MDLFQNRNPCDQQNSSDQPLKKSGFPERKKAQAIKVHPENNNYKHRT